MSSTLDGQEKAIARLLANRVMDAATGCWLWTGTLIGNGYGYIRYDGKSEYVHRLAATAFLNFDPESSLYVLHTCDEPACFNPSHLFFGTAKDNMRDAAAKGRLGKKKLDPDKVSTIKYEVAFKKTPYRRLALQYGVTTATIGQIARGETWRTVQAAPPSDEGGGAE